MAENYWLRRATRRRFVGGTAAGIGMAGLLAAGCSSSNNTTNNKAAAPVASQAPAVASATSTSAATRAAASASASPAGSPVAAAAANSSAPAEPAGLKRGGTVVWPQRGFDHLDPHLSSVGTGLFPIQLIYSGLTRMRTPSDGRVLTQPDLATSWEQPDSATWIFKLAPNVKWQNVKPTNGRAFSSDDVKAAFDRMITPDLGSEPSGLAAFLALLGTQLSIPDANTVQFKFKSPFGTFPQLIGDAFHLIVPKELFTSDQAKSTAVGTGPYYIDNYTSDVAMNLKANPAYFKPGQPYMAGVQFPIIPDATALQDKFLAKQADVWAAPFQLKDDIKAKVPGVVFNDVPYGPYAIEMNVTKGPLADKRVRQAIAFAVDTNLVKTVGNQGRGLPGQPFGSLLKPYQLPDSDLLKRDVQKAKQLLAAAGFANGIDIENTIPSAFSLDAGPEQIRTSLAEAGIRMKHKQIDFGQWRASVVSGGQMDVTTTWAFGFPNPAKQLWIKYHSTAGTPTSSYKSPQFDALWDKANSTLDAEAAKKAWQDACRFLIDDAPAAWTIETFTFWAQSARVKNWAPDVGSNVAYLNYKGLSEAFLDG